MRPLTSMRTPLPLVLLVALAAPIGAQPAPGVSPAAADPRPSAKPAAHTIAARAVLQAMGEAFSTEPRADGSGVIVDPAGYILTNHHVIENAQDITGRLSDSRKFTAILVGRDPTTDLAVLEGVGVATDENFIHLALGLEGRP